MANSQHQEFIIYNACGGDYCDGVTPELMRSLGFEAYTDENGDFCPLSPREVDIVAQNDLIAVGSEGKEVIRFLRAYLIDGKKFLNISDDDYSESHTIERTLNNYKNSREAFEKMAAAFEVELTDERKNNDDGTIAEYCLDIYVPMTKFDSLQNGKQLLDFFKACTFESPESINKAIEAVVNS